MEATVVLPNQLFSNHPEIKQNPVFLVEEDAYFTRLRARIDLLMSIRRSDAPSQYRLREDFDYCFELILKEIDILEDNIQAYNART